MKNKPQKDKEFVLSSPFLGKSAIVSDFTTADFPKKSGRHLVVRTPFRDYKKGDIITQADEIKKIESCHEHGMVVKVTVKG